MRVKEGVRGFAAVAITAALATLAGIGAANVKMPVDSGKFILTIKGEKVGTDTFTADGTGNSDGDVAISVGGNDLKFHIVVKSAKGAVTTLTTDAGGDNRFTLGVNGDDSKLTVGGGDPQQVSLPKPFIPFGNYAPHLLQYGLASYNTAKGGSQTLTFLYAEGIPPSGPVQIKGTLKALGDRKATHLDKTVSINRYTLTVTGPAGDIDLKLYTDTAGKLLMWDVPSQSYTAVRAGYEDVAKQMATP